MFAPKTQHNTNPSSTKSKGAENFIQSKLNIGKPGDKYEVEADRAADNIVAKGNENQSSFFTPGIQKKETEEIQQKESSVQEIQQKPVVDSISPIVQLKPDANVQMVEAVQLKEEEDVQMKEEETIQTKPETIATNDIIQQQGEEDLQEKAEEEVQEKEEQQLQMYGGDENSSLESDLNNSKGGGNPLSTHTKNEMESGFGTDFSGVRVHNDNNAVQMNRQLGSQAFTNGNDVYFNEGKYNPESDSGKHLLAHELTHTVQQGASPANNQIQKAAENKPVEVGTPTTVIDITNGLQLSQDWLKYIEENPKTKKIDVQVKIGSQFSGTIKLKKIGRPKEGEQQKFELASTKLGNYLDVKGMEFMNPLRDAGVYPVLVLNKFGEEQSTTGFLSIRKEQEVVPNVLGIIKGINENLEAMSFLGLSPIKVAEGLENKFENGGLNFKANNLSANVDGYIEASGNMGITNSSFTFDVSSTVDVAGLASGEFNLSRGEDGKLSGKANIAASIANINANLIIEYDKGAVTIQGTGKMASEKFSGEITLIVTDKVKSDQMMDAALGVESMDKEANTPPKTPEKAVAKTNKNQVLAGWGEVQATITPWLAGTAKIGIDSAGHVTIVGEVAVQDEVELMEQRGKKVDIFNIEIRAGYGIPLVGQVFLFAGIGMFVNAGFGPLVLKNVGFTGKYSTDPSKLQDFSITGTLGINAFVILGLEAEAGVGLTLLGHDLKAGVNVTAAAGLRAYAEATPTFEYKEKLTEGGKVGESRLKGHFEAAAQLFLQLSGALFYELDSPWWSPAPDGREEFPLGDVQYPIGDSMGIGADIDWLVGSEEAPELAFSPVEFDADKFTADVMADPPPRKMGKADANPAGEWKGEPGSEKEKDPKVTGDGKGLPENGKKKEDLKKLPDEQKYMRALDEMSKLEKLKPKPTYAVVAAKAKKVKAKYGLGQIRLQNKEKDSVKIFVRHAKEDNSKHLLKIPLMSEAERFKLLGKAMTDLRIREGEAAGEAGTMDEKKAKEFISIWHKAHPVIEKANVVDGKDTWNYFIDIGDKSETEKGKPKKGEKNAKATIGKEVKFKMGEESHRIWITFKGKKAVVMMASDEKPLKEQDITEEKSEGTKDLLKVTNDIESEATKINQELENGLKTPEQVETSDDVVENKEEKLPTIINAINSLEDVDDSYKEYFKIITQLPEINPKKQEDPQIFKTGTDNEISFEEHSTGDLGGGTWKIGLLYEPLKQAGLAKGQEKSTLKLKTKKILNSMIDNNLVSKIVDRPQLYTIVGKPGYQKEVEAPGGGVKFRDHNNFANPIMTIKKKNGVYHAAYEGGRADEQGVNGKSKSRFDIEISYADAAAEVKDYTEKRVIKGQDLIIKPEKYESDGVKVGRGRTDPGKSLGRDHNGDMIGFDNAHIVGDQFGGSGLNANLNIAPSSVFYNRSEMAGVENKMAKQIKKNNEAAFKYNLQVTAKLKDDQDSTMTSQLKGFLNENITQELKEDKITIDEDKANIKGKLLKKLQEALTLDFKKVPAQFVSTEYKTDFEVLNEEAVKSYSDKEKTILNKLNVYNFETLNETKQKEIIETSVEITKEEKLKLIKAINRRSNVSYIPNDKTIKIGADADFDRTKKAYMTEGALREEITSENTSK